jgi:hypothetical protein
VSIAIEMNITIKPTAMPATATRTMGLEKLPLPPERTLRAMKKDAFKRDIYLLCKCT